MDQYIVIGNPIAHSKSPQIHTDFATQTQEQLVYQQLLVEIGQFSQAVDQFRHQGGLGANVTVPFKLDAYHYATTLTDRARAAGAVNTLKFNRDGTVLGDNTDGVGLIHDIVQNQQQVIQGKRVLILGAGGATRGVILPMLAQQPAYLMIANRTKENAQSLAQYFADEGHEINAGGYDDIQGHYDVVINATSAGLFAQAPAISGQVFAPNAFAYDMVYAKEPTPFMLLAQQHGATTADGLGMLVEQAAESFYLWRGVRPETKMILEKLRQRL